ncbi:MAG TPA: hypothetical protein VN814_19075 [Caulobacteraceae bacterium]|nr:hypothetical protein [Caulobacteraceae bacterium]
MDKTKLGVLGAVSALVALPVGAQAATPAVAPAQSFAELLQPIPNAVERLNASDAELGGGARLMDAAYRDHHHDHGHYRRHHHPLRRVLHRLLPNHHDHRHDHH